MSLPYVAYGTVATLGTIALLRFASNIRKYASKTKANQCLILSIYAIAICSFMEFCFCFHESGLITSLVFCYSTEICYSIFSLVGAYFWCLCSELEQNAWILRTKPRFILVTIPFVIMALAVLSTPFTHIVFYFTTDGHYVRGLLNNPLVYLTAIWIAETGICALIRSFNSKYYLKRQLFYLFFCYAIALLAAVVLQILIGSVLPFRIVGAVFVFYLIQEHIFKQNIYLDNLSNANNRTAMERYLRINFANASENFAYVMIDMDSFKYINDHYGHSTGDKVITMISDAFKLVLPSHLFFARFGGDEFCVVGTVADKDEIDNTMQAARVIINRMAKENHLDFCPDFSYGVAYKTGTISSIPELMNQADVTMYENKKARKSSGFLN